MTQKNILQIDVEDWYQGDGNTEDRGAFEDRIVESTGRVLELLELTSNRATFFVLGYVAERFPELVRRIARSGHEVASHGYAHKRLTMLSPEQFEDDLMKSISTIESITGDRILGYRAPGFSVGDRTSWAIDILRKHGLKYDSSVFPVSTHLYGVPDAPLFPYFVSSASIRVNDPDSGLLEVPLSVYRMPLVRRNLPIAGGFYLGLFPYRFIRHGLRKINSGGQPAVCYLHPWELDSEQPRVDGLSWYHYYRLSQTEAKFRQLLSDFEFTSVQDCLLHTWPYCRTQGVSHAGKGPQRRL